MVRKILSVVIPRFPDGTQCRNTFESISRPIGMLFGGLIVEKYLTAFSENNNALMTAIFYNTTGSNIGLLFIFTGVLGFLSCIYCLLAFMKNSSRDYKSLKKWESIKKGS